MARRGQAPDVANEAFELETARVTDDAGPARGKNGAADLPGGKRFCTDFERRVTTAVTRHNEPMVRHRVRIRFRKDGDLRLIGHHDLARAWERTFRRAQIAVRMSEGFHPKPRMVFASALAMGVVGADEALDVELAEPRPADELLSALAARLPAGLSIHSLDLLPEDAPKSRVEQVEFELAVPVERLEAVADRLRDCPTSWRRRPASVNAAETATPQLRTLPSTDDPPADGTSARDPWEFVERIELLDGILRFTARVTPQGTTRPRELLSWLGLADLDEQGVYLTRTKVELAT
jgi:radical SAM-linked protein